MMSSNIVVGADFSEPSTTAARWVAHHLAGEESDVVLVHVIYVPRPPSFLRGLFPPSDQLVEDARRGAELRLRELGRSLEATRVRSEIRVGRVEEELLDVAAELDADLLVVGPHGGRPGLGRLLGSTAERVARRASTSVLLGRSLSERGLATVLVALDESDLTDPVLQWAEWLGRREGVRIVVLHVVNPFAYGAVGIAASSAERARATQQLREGAESWARERVAELGIENVAIETSLGDVALEILGAVERVGADLLVIGRSGSGRARERLLGSVVEFVLRHGTGPVLVVADGPPRTP